MVNKRIGYFLVVLVMLMGFGSCDMFVNFFGTTIDERIDSFNDDAKAGNYSSMYSHFHSDTKERDDMKNDPNTYWNTTPMASENYIDSYSVSGDTASGKLKSGDTFSAEMKRDGLDYLIYQMDFGTGFDIRRIE